MMKPIRVGLVGATGLVGDAFVQLLEEKDFPLSHLTPFASEQSQGKKIRVHDREFTVETLSDERLENLDVVFFSSGEDISKEWGPRAVQKGAVVIDNSSAFRMDPEILLCVPEINGDQLPKPGRAQLIANPNCSTIQLVIALAPLEEAFGIDEVQVASYQAVSGAGREALVDLIDQSKAVLAGDPLPPTKVFKDQIAFNTIPQIGSMDPSGYCTEELKIMRETKKILGLPNLKISSSTVRVPGLNGHSEAVWVRLNKEVSKRDILKVFGQMSGLVVVDEEKQPPYPLAATASGTDPVYVGRIRQVPHDPKVWQMWVVADNLRKGAALNGLQIAERIFDRN